MEDSRTTCLLQSKELAAGAPLAAPLAAGSSLAKWIKMSSGWLALDLVLCKRSLGPDSVSSAGLAWHCLGVISQASSTILMQIGHIGLKVAPSLAVCIEYCRQPCKSIGAKPTLKPGVPSFRLADNIQPGAFSSRALPQAWE